MKLHYRRSGGIANVPVSLEIDSGELSAASQRILTTLQTVDLREPVHSDDFFHELTFEDGRKVVCTESRCPAELLPLFDDLYAIYLTQRRQD